jgi:hypothetical protein
MVAMVMMRDRGDGDDGGADADVGDGDDARWWRW